jgi:hypothetical protein
MMLLEPSADADAANAANAANAATGHVFALSNRGVAVCKLEVVFDASNRQLKRVALVQADYDPLSVEGGIADPSSLLVYERPNDHLARLHEVDAELRKPGGESMYVPTSECCISKQFKAVPLTLPPTHGGIKNHRQLATARQAWSASVAFLETLSTVTANCIDAHNAAEIERANAHELRTACTQWRVHV